MSMNICFEAVREIIVVKTGKTEEQVIEFDYCWQTPTKVTYKIQNSANPIQAYCDWVRENSSDEEEQVWDDLGERLIGTEIVNYGEIHIKEFLEWVKLAEEQGYQVISQIG